MNLENSPFHITKNKVFETNKPVLKNTTNQQQTSKTEDGSSFWNWFRGGCLYTNSVHFDSLGKISR